MPGLKAVWICPYLTTGGTWRQADYNATKMVKAVKEKPFNGYFDVMLGGTRRRFDSDNALEFLSTVHNFMAKMILDRVQGDATLIPIPNSTVISCDDPTFKTKGLAEGIASFSNGRLSPATHLVFRETQASSSSGGGSRDPHHFEEAYQLIGTPSGQVVFVDDVLTSGSHLIGACWKLEGVDCQIALAATWGRTVSEQLDPVFKVREEELPLARFTADFDDVVF